MQRCRQDCINGKKIRNEGQLKSQNSNNNNNVRALNSNTTIILTVHPITIFKWRSSSDTSCRFRDYITIIKFLC